MRDLARRCRDSMRHQGVAGSPPPAVLIPQDVRNVVREPASHALGQRGLSARSAAADTPPAGMLAAGWPAATGFDGCARMRATSVPHPNYSATLLAALNRTTV